MAPVPPLPRTLVFSRLLLLLVVLAAPALLLTSAQFPIPARYDGLVFHPGAAPPRRDHPIVLEAFLDLTCPSCQTAWPVLRHVATFYGPKRVLLVAHLFSNAFHLHSYTAAKATNAIAAMNASLAFSWIDVLYKSKTQAALSNGATWAQTPSNVLWQLAGLAERELGVNGAAFVDRFLKDADVEMATRIAFKYGASRGVVGTPSFLVNGVAVPGADDSWTIYDWRALIDPLLPADHATQLAH